MVELFSLSELSFFILENGDDSTLEGYCED